MHKYVFQKCPFSWEILVQPFNNMSSPEIYFYFGLYFCCCVFKGFVCIFVLFVGKGLVCIFVCYCASLDHFGFVLLVLLDLVFPVPSQELGREGRLRNNLFCVGWDVKPCSIHLIHGSFLGPSDYTPRTASVLVQQF